MKEKSGQRLIDEMLADPEGFVERGGPYDLLQAYFNGFPIDTLRPLLESPDPWVQRASGFVAAELGSQAEDLVDDVLPLLLSSDRFAQNSAMEVLIVNAIGEHAAKFAYVARKIESEDVGIRSQAMDLVSNADVSQLEAAARFFAEPAHANKAHVRGLRALASAGRPSDDAVIAMLRDRDPLIRRYGAIAAKKMAIQVPADTIQDPQLLEYLGQSVDWAR